MIEQAIIQKQKTAWTRKQLSLMELLQELENELSNMKKKGVNPDFIQKKSDQIDLIISLFNYASEFIDLLLLDRSSSSIEIHCLQNELTKNLMSDMGKKEKFLSSENTFEHLQDLVKTYKAQRHED